MEPIAVTPDQLKSQAKIYQQSALQIQEAIRKVNTMNQQIAHNWKGQTFQAYLDQYHQLEGSVKQMKVFMSNSTTMRIPFQNGIVKMLGILGCYSVYQ